ncbi:hypothetical protein BH11PAT4_BH11PAT4_1260 [soil metagenome]
METRTKSLITVLLGGGFLVALVLSSMLPRSCPILRDLITSCPSQQDPTKLLSANQKEINRIPHQVIAKETVDFAVPAQENRTATQVRFTYRGDLAKQFVYLKVVEQNGEKILTVVNHPLLYNLDWERTSTTEPNVTMYQKGTTFTSAEELRASLPSKAAFAADTVIARDWNLTPDQYTPLDEKLTTLEGITTIATSYTPPEPDGQWYKFSQTFDLTNAFVDGVTKNLKWFLKLPGNTGEGEPFRMSTVNVGFTAKK